ncbi:MAG: hypothetical protein CMJ46_11235 [Planctomyces sp.]|nr:hypothetical protein [Planctomyces sp.]
MNMTKHYQTELALLVGDDLSEAEAVEVYRHLSTCPECRAHLQKLRKSQNALSEYALETSASPKVDLRARVQKSLPTPAQIQRRHRILHNWAPAATVVVACTLLFMVMSPEQSTPTNNTGHVSAPSGGRMHSIRDDRVTFDQKHLDELTRPEHKSMRGIPELPRYQPSDKVRQIEPFFVYPSNGRN